MGRKGSGFVPAAPFVALAVGSPVTARNEVTGGAGSLQAHIARYALAASAGNRSLRLASVRSYLKSEALAGRLDAKLPHARAFVRMVKEELAADASVGADALRTTPSSGVTNRSRL